MLGDRVDARSLAGFVLDLVDLDDQGSDGATVWSLPFSTRVMPAYSTPLTVVFTAATIPASVCCWSGSASNDRATRLSISATIGTGTEWPIA